jgi:hypothetical protein
MGGENELCLNFVQARELVKTIEYRLNVMWEYKMSDGEYEAMVDYFCKVGTSSLDIPLIADNYFINAEKKVFDVSGEADEDGEISDEEMEAEEECLFYWVDNGRIKTCVMSWLKN